MKIAGLDIGTTGCKLTVFDEKGRYLDTAYKNYPSKRQNSGHEIDAGAIIKGVLDVMKAMGEKHPDIGGIGVTSFGETFVLADEEGNPLHIAMLYTDPRGKQECKELVEKMGEKNIASITGLAPHEMYSISKIMWMKRNRPEIYRQAKHIFLMQDLVVFHLTGKAQMDYSLATRTMGFDITTLEWCREIFSCADIDVGLMSELVPTGTLVGCLRQKIAEITGLSVNTKIVSVSHDQVAAAVGAGVFDAGKMVDGAGTVECMIVVYDKLPDLEDMFKGKFAVVPYVIPGKYLAYAFSYTGGALIQWCVETLAKKEQETAKELGISVNEFLEEEFQEPTGLLALPHFAGAATPYMDTGSKGAIVGLTVNTSIREIYRACMEGVVYEMLVNIEYLKSSKPQYKMIHATGGGAKSQTWMQMKADMLNVPIKALKTPDAGTVGSAMLTGIAVGCFKNLEEAAAYMVEEKKIYYPRKEMHEKYEKVYKRYRRLYDAVRPLV